MIAGVQRERQKVSLYITHLHSHKDLNTKILAGIYGWIGTDQYQHDLLNKYMSNILCITHTSTNVRKVSILEREVKIIFNY